MGAVGVREPIKLTLLKGKKHLTKAEIQERIDSEVKVGNDAVKSPAYLPKELKKEFNKIAKELIKCDLLTNLDVDVLARFLISREQYVKTMEQLRDIDPTDDIIYYEKVLRVNDKLFQQLSKSSNELGLTVTSRGRIRVPKFTPEEIDKVEQKFGV